MKPRFTRLALSTSLPLVFATYTQAQTFNPANDGGTWGSASNWSPATVPNAVDAESILNGAGPSGTSPATLALDVLLDGNYTIGKLTRSATGSQPATLPTSPTANDPTKGLTLQKSAGTPEINVLGDVFYYSSIFGTQGFEKTNSGRFTFRFNGVNQNYTGTVKISGGTLGIEKDRSLGDVNNDIEITPTAAVDSTLFAEPGNNTNAITLPDTRTITLNDANPFDPFDPCLSANATAVVFTIEGAIGEVASSGSFLKKTGPGVVVLKGTNSWSGGTIVSAGVLTAAQPAAFPGYDTLPYLVNGTSTLAVRYGDASTWTDTQIGDLFSNSGLVFASGAGFGIDTTGNAAEATFSGDISAPSFSKIGAGTLILADPQTTITGLSLFGGTLQLGAAGGLPAGLVFKNLVSGSTLDLGGTAASFNDLQEVSGGTTTITNGSLTYAGPTLTLSGNNGTITDLSGLSSFTYATSGTELKIENTNNVNASVNTTLLATGTNTITASSRVGVGGGASASNGPHTTTLRLGTENTINTALFNLGGFNAAGIVNFQTGLTSPTLKLRAADGIAPIPLLKVGETSSGTRSGAGTLNLTNGTADIVASDIVIGRHIAGSNNGDTSTLTVQAGTVSSPTLLMAEKTSGGSPAVTAIFNQQGSAAVAIDSITMAQTVNGASGNNAAAFQYLFPTYNLEGGILTTSEIKPGTLATALTTQAQIETATAVGTITAAGTVNVTVTGAGIAGSPLVIPVTVANGDTAAVWAGKVTSALAATPAITALYNVTNTTTAIVLTRNTVGINDGTLNVALANNTATGVTAAPTSANTNGNVISNITRTLKLQGGTLINKIGGNLNISGPTPPLAPGNNPTTILIPGNTTAIVDSTPGQSVNFTDVTFSGRINSATPAAGTLQVDGDVVLAAASLTLFDDAPTNAVIVPGGMKLVLIDYQDGSLTGTFTGIADGATVNLTKGAVTNSFILDYNDPAFGGKAVTLTSTAVGGDDDYASWAMDNGISGAAFGEDFDKDGIDNGVEYALGLNPTLSSVPTGTVSNGGLTTTYTKGADAKANGDVTWDIETSVDLGITDEWKVNTTLVTETEDDISITFTPGTPAKNFARLKVVQVP